MEFNYLHTVQYYETDQMQVVHHSNYIRWFEEARTAYFNKLGVNYAQIEREGIIIPVTEASCKYQSMTRFGDSVNICCKVIKFNGVVLQISYTVSDAKTKEIRAKGETSHCFLDRNNNILRLRKSNKELYDKLAGELNLDV